jgi:hypothetical protein
MQSQQARSVFLIASSTLRPQHAARRWPAAHIGLSHEDVASQWASQRSLRLQTRQVSARGLAVDGTPRRVSFNASIALPMSGLLSSTGISVAAFEHNDVRRAASAKGRITDRPFGDDLDGTSREHFARHRGTCNETLTCERPGCGHVGLTSVTVRSITTFIAARMFLALQQCA